MRLVLELGYKRWLLFVFQKLILCLALVYVRNVARNWRHTVLCILIKLSITLFQAIKYLKLNCNVLGFW